MEKRKKINMRKWEEEADEGNKRIKIFLFL